MRFGIIGASGYVAPRHLAAIQAVGGRLVVAQDIADSAGTLDRYFPDAAFFTEIDRLERHLAKEAREGRRLDYLSVCSPNHLHDAHVRFALRNGADAICEKPVVINPWNLDLLRDEEARYGRRIWTILQLRLLPSLRALHERVHMAEPGRHFVVDLSYITERGAGYFASWKGDEELSGGIATNIGIHLFDLLQWIFGPVRELDVHVRRPEVVAGALALERADVRWFLSVDASHLPIAVRSAEGRTFRSITIDGEEVDFTDYSSEGLHALSYRSILANSGFSLDDAAPSVELAHRVRTAPLKKAGGIVPPQVPEVLK